MESKKINQLATELTPSLSDLTIIGDPTTGISKKITLSQMASLFTGTVEEYANVAAFPLVGTADTIYIALDTNVLYRWNGTAYVELSPNIVSSLVFNDANGFDGTINLVGSVATLTITTALTLGSLPFIGASGALTQDNANLFYDDANNRLGIGTNAPTTPLDVFGSGIIARVNGTSTNNAFLGFGSAGTNRWSVGNVQSDHRFRIFSEANTAELVSILQTGEFGIGIANPTTKLHLDGGATALIANLDANVSVAKSISFRSDNSNRFNIEVSGTESGSNAGADFFIRRYSDAGSLIDTPLTIIRSTGNATFSGILTTPQVKAATSAGLSINANSGTQVADFGAGGSANITFFGGLNGTSATFSSTASATAFIPTASSVPTNGMYLSGTNTLDFATNSTNRLSITSAGNVEVKSAGKLIAYRSDNNRFGEFYTDGVAVHLTASTDPIRLTSPERIDFYTAATERMRITSGGDLQLTSGVASFTRSGKKIELNANSANANVDAEIEITSGMNLFFKLGGSERMRIPTNGGVQSTPAVGSNAFIAGVSGTAIAYLSSLASTSDFSGYWIVAGNFAGSITHPTNTSTNYNTTSDYRLKENIKPLSNGLESILKLKPVTGNYKSDPNKTNMPMFLAHEVQEVVPIAVTGEKDAVKFNKQTEKEDMDIQQLDASKLIPHMVKAIQELKAEIDLLKGIAPIEPEPIEEVEPIAEPINESEPKAEPTQPEADSDTETQPNN